MTYWNPRPATLASGAGSEVVVYDAARGTEGSNCAATLPVDSLCPSARTVSGSRHPTRRRRSGRGQGLGRRHAVENCSPCRRGNTAAVGSLYPRWKPATGLGEPHQWLRRASARLGRDPAAGAEEVTDVTRILAAIEGGDPSAAARLLPLVYDELRKLAAARLAREKPGQTLQATALVHEAYVRLVGRDAPQTGTAAGTSSPPRPRPCAASWSNRPAARSRSSAAATATGPTSTSRDLADAGAARRSARHRRGARPDSRRPTRRPRNWSSCGTSSGCPIPDAAATLGLSTRAAERLWTYARAWLRRAIEGA